MHPTRNKTRAGDGRRRHDRCGIDFVRWEGTERKSRAELKRAFEAIRPLIRERQQLHELFSIEKLEYPTFARQEAIVNAVAHRDYSIRGLGIEVWMYDDRMEIRSPGMPPRFEAVGGAVVQVTLRNEPIYDRATPPPIASVSN